MVIRVPRLVYATSKEERNEEGALGGGGMQLGLLVGCHR